MAVRASLHGLPVSFASRLLKSHSKVASLGCGHILVMEDPLRKVQLGFCPLFFSLSLRVCHSLLKGRLAELSDSHLPTSDLKTVVFNKAAGGRCPAVLANPFLPVRGSETPRGERASLHGPAMAVRSF